MKRSTLSHSTLLLASLFVLYVSLVESVTTTDPLASKKKHRGYKVDLFAYNATQAAPGAGGKEEGGGPLFLSDKATTLVTHVTVDRRDKLISWCKVWRGPVSVALFRRPQQDKELSPSSPGERDTLLQTLLQNDACLLKHVSVHVVSVKDTTADGLAMGISGKSMFSNYPFNVQRNAALDGALTKKVFLVDSDFWLFPTTDGAPYERRLNELATWASSRRGAGGAGGATVGETDDDPNSHLPKAVESLVSLDSEKDKEKYFFVVPAVETVTTDVEPPTTPSALAASIQNHEVVNFYGHHCRDCHNPTNALRFTRLLVPDSSGGTDKSQGDTQQHPQPYLVNYVDGYEPYVVALDKTLLPRYDERYVGRGWSKMSFFYEVSVGLGFQFVVLPAENLKVAAPNAKKKKDKVLSWPFLVHSGRGNTPSSGDHDEEYRLRQRSNRHCWDNFRLDVKKQRHQRMMQNQDNNQQDQQSKTEEEVKSGDVDPIPDSTIDWSVVSSSTLGRDSTCVARVRTPDDIIEFNMAQVVAEICAETPKLDCSPVLDPSGIRNQVDWAFKADWVFDRAYHLALDQSISDARDFASNHEGTDGEPATPREQLCYEVSKGLGIFTHCAKAVQCCAPRRVEEKYHLERTADWICNPYNLGPCNRSIQSIIPPTFDAKRKEFLDNMKLKGEDFSGMSDEEIEAAFNDPNELRVSVEEYLAVGMTFYHMLHRCTTQDVDKSCDFNGGGRLVDCSSEGMPNPGPLWESRGVPWKDKKKQQQQQQQDLGIGDL